jgi:hypothetical protein
VANVPTDRRATVRVLLRLGTPFGGAAMQKKLGGYLVIIVGEAKRADWPGAAVRVGDVEGIVWTTPRQVATVVNNLRACSGVLEARGPGEGEDET